MKNTALLALAILLGILVACSPTTDTGSGNADSVVSPTPTPTATPSSGEALGGNDGPELITEVPVEDESDSNEGEAPADGEPEFVSVDLCVQVPKELVPCGEYIITFSSDSMTCGGVPVPRQPEQDRDTLLFQPEIDGNGKFRDTPVQTVGSDGSVIVMHKEGETEGSKSYRGKGEFPPRSSNEPARKIEWAFAYDTSAATIEGTLVATFEVPQRGECTVTKDFEGSPG